MTPNPVLPDLAVNPGIWMTGWPDDRAAAVVGRLAAIGYPRVVVVLRDPHRFEVEPVRALLQGAGLRAVANSNQVAGEDVASDDPAVRSRGVARLRRAIALARDLGADQLTGITYGVLGKAAAPVPIATFERTARLLGELADEAAESGVRLLCEVVNRYETAMLTTARRAMEFAQLSGSDHLGLHLDVFHMNIEEDDMVAAVAEALPRLAYLELEQNHRGELRSGHLRLDEFLDGVLAAGYRGRFGLEAFTARALDPDHAAGLAVWRDVLDPETRIAEDAFALVRDAIARRG